MSTSNELPSLTKIHQLPPLEHPGAQAQGHNNIRPTSAPQLPLLSTYRFPPKNEFCSPERPPSTDRFGHGPSSSTSPGRLDHSYPEQVSPDSSLESSLLTEPLKIKMEDPYLPAYRRHSIAAASRFNDGGSPLSREIDPRDSHLPPPPPLPSMSRNSLHPHDVRIPGPRDLPPIPEMNTSPNKRKEPSSPADHMRPDNEIKRPNPHGGEYYAHPPPPPLPGHEGGRHGPAGLSAYPRNRLLPPGAYDNANRRFSLPAPPPHMPRPGPNGSVHQHSPHHTSSNYNASSNTSTGAGPPPNYYSRPPPPSEFAHPAHGGGPSSSSFRPPTSGPSPPGPNGPMSSSHSAEIPDYPDSFNMARRASMPVIAHDGMKPSGDRFHHPSPYPGPTNGTSGRPEGASGPYGYPHPFSSLNGHGYVAHREIAKSETPYSRSPELRVSHKMAERKRRKEMKDLFDELRDTLPLDKSLKTSKWEILSKAIDFITALKSSESDLRSECDSLRNQLSVLKQGRRSST
ncbi:hypothetical protein H4R33_005939 [Dimargaris cristalligena]|nr:hypothetical protein H4R33_005939 [Dimargaris cristalligena]